MEQNQHIYQPSETSEPEPPVESLYNPLKSKYVQKVLTKWHDLPIMPNEYNAAYLGYIYERSNQKQKYWLLQKHLQSIKKLKLVNNNNNNICNNNNNNTNKSFYKHDIESQFFDNKLKEVQERLQVMKKIILKSKIQEFKEENDDNYLVLPVFRDEIVRKCQNNKSFYSYKQKIHFFPNRENQQNIKRYRSVQKNSSSNNNNQEKKNKFSTPSISQYNKEMMSTTYNNNNNNNSFLNNQSYLSIRDKSVQQLSDISPVKNSELKTQQQNFATPIKIQDESTITHSPINQNQTQSQNMHCFSAQQRYQTPQIQRNSENQNESSNILIQKDFTKRNSTTIKKRTFSQIKQKDDNQIDRNKSFSQRISQFDSLSNNNLSFIQQQQIKNQQFNQTGFDKQNINQFSAQLTNYNSINQLNQQSSQIIINDFTPGSPEQMKDFMQTVKKLYKSNRKITNAEMLIICNKTINLVQQELQFIQQRIQQKKGQYQLMKRKDILTEKMDKMIKIKQYLDQCQQVKEIINVSEKKINFEKTKYDNKSENIEFFYDVIQLYDNDEENISKIVLKMRQNEYLNNRTYEEQAVKDYKQNIMQLKNPYNSVFAIRQNMLKKSKLMQQEKKKRQAKDLYF